MCLLFLEFLGQVFGTCNVCRLDLRIHRLGNPHQEATEKEEEEEGDTHKTCKSIPIVFRGVNSIEIPDLDREVAGHETDRKEEYAKLGKQCC
jgi:hypothetical protein